MIADLFIHSNWYSMMVYILQRIVRDIISNSRKIVGHFKNSLLSCSRLQHSVSVSEIIVEVLLTYAI